tara:strand:- start:555 stop:728 length:174 start_codon:yes stop_codon:yes gene_type:complete
MCAYVYQIDGRREVTVTAEQGGFAVKNWRDGECVSCEDFDNETAAVVRAKEIHDLFA